jgi:NitT/TauT family transport system ATP-binding protein
MNVLAPWQFAELHDRDITISGLSKSFEGLPLYSNFDLTIPYGRFLSIFGPNGCGKSTLINMMAGLLPADKGRILFGGKPLRDTVVGYVFQDYRGALMPWMSAASNVVYPLIRKGVKALKARQRLEELKAVFEVRFDLARYPYQLSGGQQQLVSIMRALAPKPEVLLLDEPFSALDFEATLFIRDKLQRVQVSESMTIVIVSHDLEDAVFLADLILLLTRRPTKVAGLIHFDLPKPRGPESIADPQFVTTQAQALEIFRAALKG